MYGLADFMECDSRRDEMKIGVIGAGAVGVGICSYLLTLGSVSELALLDMNRERAEG